MEHLANNGVTLEAEPHSSFCLQLPRPHCLHKSSVQRPHTAAAVSEPRPVVAELCTAGRDDGRSGRLHGRGGRTRCIWNKAQTTRQTSSPGGRRNHKENKADKEDMPQRQRSTMIINPAVVICYLSFALLSRASAQPYLGAWVVRPTVPVIKLVHNGSKTLPPETTSGSLSCDCHFMQYGTLHRHPAPPHGSSIVKYTQQHGNEHHEHHCHEVFQQHCRHHVCLVPCE